MSYGVICILANQAYASSSISIIETIIADSMTTTTTMPLSFQDCAVLLPISHYSDVMIFLEYI